MKKYLLSLLSLMMVTFQALAVTTDGLKEIFDDLNYSLIVEWDQKDQNFQEQQKQIFADRLVELKANGLTNDEMIKFALSQIKNEKFAKDAKQIFSLLDQNQVTAEEALLQASDLLNKSYTVGANWSGRATIITVAGAISIYVVVCLVTGNPIGGIIVGEHPHGHGR